MKDVIIMNMPTLLVLMATLLPEVTAAVLFTPFQTRQGMFILLAYQVDLLKLLVGVVTSLTRGMMWSKGLI